MNADDISEYLERVKRAEDIGLAAEWRSDMERVCIACGTTEGMREGDIWCEKDDPSEEPTCRRCRKPLEPLERNGASLCHSCSVALFGEGV